MKILNKNACQQVTGSDYLVGICALAGFAFSTPYSGVFYGLQSAYFGAMTGLVLENYGNFLQTVLKHKVQYPDMPHFLADFSYMER